jgi:hypothetical protein
MSEPVNTRAPAARADLETVRRAKPGDFDGHTEFHRLPPRQRLAWLDEAVAFITAAKSANRALVARTAHHGK